MRRKCKTVYVGKVPVGGEFPVTVQSMLNVPWNDVEGNVKQAVLLQDSGCDIIRIAVPCKEAVKTLFAVKNAVDMPVVADIHFDYRLAIESVGAGADKIRINPGNIGCEDKIKAVVKECKNHNVPIRIGVNSGSLEPQILSTYGKVCPEAMVQSALHHAAILEKFDFNDIIISMKSSDVKNTVDAYRLLAHECCYPFHVGITEAGTEKLGVIRSFSGIGSLLLDGIGDTIRISLTDNPQKEVLHGIDLLRALELKNDGIRFVSCPTCGRTNINLISLAKKAEETLKDCKKNIKVAIMGCVVNGPGEAKDADIGITGGNGVGIIFKKGVVVKKVDEADLLDELISEIEKM